MLSESELPPLTADQVGQLANQPRFMVALALAEAETLRLILHTNQAALSWAGLALRTADGALIEASSRFLSAGPSTQQQVTLIDTCVQCLRFFNNEMYFTPAEIEV